MTDITSIIMATFDDHELSKLEFAVRKELRERAVNALTEVPRPTPEEFALLKERPSDCLYAYRKRTGLKFHAVSGVFNRLYGLNIR